MEQQPINQPFIVASEIERNYIKTFSALNPEFDVWKMTSTSGTSTFDAYVVSGFTFSEELCHHITNNWAVEVKIRTNKIDTYPTAYIKCKKWYDMTQTCNTEKYMSKRVQPIYVMFFTDGNVAVWNLFHSKKKYVEKKYKEFNVTNSKVVTNKLFELDFKDATIYRWK